MVILLLFTISIKVNFISTQAVVMGINGATVCTNAEYLSVEACIL